MRDLDLQGRKFVKKSAVDEPHCRHHQGEFPAEHTAEIVCVHVCPADDPWQRVDENVEAEVGGGLPKWAQSIHVECLPLELGSDDDPRKPQLDGTTPELGRCLVRI
jgi:hypothetical protein